MVKINESHKCKHGTRMGGDCEGCEHLRKKDMAEITKKNMKMVTDLEKHQKRDPSVGSKVRY
jgi:hypothetical protein